MKNSTTYKSIIGASVFLILLLASSNIMAQRIGLLSATVVASSATICEGSSVLLSLDVVTCCGGNQHWATGAIY